MVPSTGEKRFDVSVYLVRPSQASIVEADLFPVTPVKYQELRNDIPGGRFLALPVDANPPKWTAHVKALLPLGGQSLDLLSQSPGGILWIPRAGKCFVFTFGYAHAKLKDEWLEPEFGKRVALNVIPQGQVVEVRAEQVFAKWHIASERAPRASAVREFGFEADRDLVAAVEGVPSQKYIPHLGAKVRGGTAFKFGMYFSKLLETLDVISERFDSVDYMSAWPQVDNLVVVRDAVLEKDLDAKLDSILKGAKPADKISLAAPALKSGDKPYPQHYLIGRLSKNPATAPYLLFGNWEIHLKGLSKPLDLNSSLETKVHLLDEHKDEIDACTMYQCFGVEVSLQGRSFVLSSGVWYEAKHQFVVETNALISGLALAPYPLPAWAPPEDEGTYNAGVPGKDGSLWLFDKKLVGFGGGKSKFEFCDLMHLNSKTLYFVKHPSSSASVSHLCEQVRRTVELFFSADGAFRKNLADKISAHDKLKDISWLASRPLRHEWHLCLVSMGPHATDFPFFAKCGVARLVRELEQGGYNVSFLAV